MNIYIFRLERDDVGERGLRDGSRYFHSWQFLRRFYDRYWKDSSDLFRTLTANVIGINRVLTATE